jgi:hypothetical protein
MSCHSGAQCSSLFQNVGPLKQRNNKSKHLAEDVANAVRIGFHEDIHFWKFGSARGTFILIRSEGGHNLKKTGKMLFFEGLLAK